MSIQKKSLISTLKTAKKANVASSSAHEATKGSKVASMRLVSNKTVSNKAIQAKGITSARAVYAKGVKHAKTAFTKAAVD